MKMDESSEQSTLRQVDPIQQCYRCLKRLQTPCETCRFHDETCQIAGDVYDIIISSIKAVIGKLEISHLR